MRIALVIAVSLLGGLLGQCGGDQPGGPPQPAGRIEFTWAGGFVGRHDVLVIEPDGSGMLTHGRPDPVRRPVRLDSRTVREARRALDEARFASIPSEAAPTGAADAFEYTIVYRGHRVVRDETDLPKDLGRPVQILRGLLEQAARSAS